MSAATVVTCTALAVFCFAANSLLCRLALAGGAIDPASFTAMRLAAGGITLWAIQRRLARRRETLRSWAAPATLFTYAAGFSFAYVSLGTGTGALILFGSVQATMLMVAIRTGERFRVPEVFGLALALAGLVVLMRPGLSAPSPIGCALMVAAGASWGVYSLLGRGSTDALGETARNFALAAVPAVALAAVHMGHARVTPAGACLALISGAITSGLGYVLWFKALGGLTAIRAATVQLAVPALAALGGVVALGEAISLRLLLASSLILGGVAVAMASRARRGP